MSEEGVAKKKMGTGAKVAIGCGSGCLVVILLMVLAGVGGGLYLKKMITKYETELKEFGFETVNSGQMIEVTEPVTEPILYKAQSIRLLSDCSTNIAVLAQMCEVSGKIEGTLYFRGQMLMIHPGAEVHGGINAQAQIIQNNGTVTGEITGKYQLIEAPAPASAE